MPGFSTVMVMLSAAAVVQTVIVSPGGVYRSALDNKLVRAWRSKVRSAGTIVLAP